MSTTTISFKINSNEKAVVTSGIVSSGIDWFSDIMVLVSGVLGVTFSCVAIKSIVDIFMQYRDPVLILYFVLVMVCTSVVMLYIACRYKFGKLKVYRDRERDQIEAAMSLMREILKGKSSHAMVYEGTCVEVRLIVSKKADTDTKEAEDVRTDPPKDPPSTGYAQTVGAEITGNGNTTISAL